MLRTVSVFRRLRRFTPTDTVSRPPRRLPTPFGRATACTPRPYRVAMGTQSKVGGKPLDAVEAFVSPWQGRDGGQERANYAKFLHELCDALGLQPPDPAGDPEMNDYVFERVVKEPGRDGAISSRRIDLSAAVWLRRSGQCSPRSHPSGLWGRGTAAGPQVSTETGRTTLAATFLYPSPLEPSRSWRELQLLRVVAHDPDVGVVEAGGARLRFPE